MESLNENASDSGSGVLPGPAVGADDGALAVPDVIFSQPETKVAAPPL